MLLSLVFDVICRCFCLKLMVTAVSRAISWLYALHVLPVTSSSTSRTNALSTCLQKNTSLSQSLSGVCGLQQSNPNCTFIRLFPAVLWYCLEGWLIHIKTFSSCVSGQFLFVSFSLTFNVMFWLSETQPLSAPIPVPRYAKNRLIALCKDVAFTVKCTTCAKVLTSHMEARAHFK